MLKVNKLLLFIFILYFTINISVAYPKNTFAQSVLFIDDFNDGVADGWSVMSSNSYLNVTNQKYGGIVNRNYTVADSVAGEMWTNYSYEVDMIAISGADVNLLFRYTDSTHRYGFHISSGTIKLEKVHPSTIGSEDVKSEPITFNYGTTYHMKVTLDGAIIKIYQNNNLVLEYLDPDPMLNGKIGIRVGTGGISPSEVWFDNIVVTEIPGTTPSPIPTVEPTTAPTPSPTAIATSMPTAIPMSVPNLKQYSLPWKDKIYDHTKRSIQEFGCALTSAAMVLQYHGHNIMPDRLNEWLKQQPDGYLSNGLVNWLAVSRYTKIHDSTNSPTLEYKRLDPTLSNLDNEINSNRPSILKEVGHFIVGTGKVSNSYTINDPGYANRETLASYDNSFLAINSYRPTHSDLSYMMFVTDPDVNLELLNMSGTPILTDSHIEEPITSIYDPTIKSGESIRITLFEKPENGKYNLKVTGQSGKYRLDSYLYDIAGVATKNTVIGSLQGGDTDNFIISFENRRKIKEKGKRSDFKLWLKRHHFYNFF